MDNQCIAGFHASPWSFLEEYIYPDYPYFDRFESLPWDYVLLGHTHYPLIKKVGRVTIINPGSCGQPRQGNYRANAAILDSLTGNVKFLNLDYDIQKFLADAQKQRVHPEVIQKLSSSIK